MNQLNGRAQQNADSGVRRGRQPRGKPPGRKVELGPNPRDHATRLEHEGVRDDVVWAYARGRWRHKGSEDHQRGPFRATLAWPIALGLLAAGCRSDLDDVDGIFYNGDGRIVHCAVNLDSSAGNSLASIDAALDRAAERSEVVELYAHRPNLTVPLAKIEHVLAGASARNLPFVTYADFATGVGTGPGLALSLDDSGVAYWMEARPLFQHYQARVTFFVSRYAAMSDDEHALIHELATDGHDIEAHSVLHLRAPSYVEDHGLHAYLDDEALPSIEVLRNDGYAVTAYAYPFGARTEELDHALSEHVSILRSVSFAVGGVADPCPN